MLGLRDLGYGTHACLIEEGFMKWMLGSVLFFTAVFAGPGLLVLSGPACAESISKDKVNIRSGPSLRSRIVYKAPLGYPIKVEKKQGKWAFFRDWENDTGWVYEPLVSEVETAVVLVKKANVRSAPGTGHKVTAKVARGDIYKILDRDGNWLKLGYYFGDDELGWIRSDLVFGD